MSRGSRTLLLALAAVVAGLLFAAAADAIPEPPIVTVAGTGGFGSTGNGGLAQSATFGTPLAVTQFGSGFLIADPFENVIRAVDSGGTIGAAAGDGSAGTGPDGPATSVPVNNPGDVAGSSGDSTFYLVDSSAVGRVRKVSAGTMTTIVGTNSNSTGQVVTSTTWPQGVAILPGGALLFTESGDVAGHGKVRYYQLGGVIDFATGLNDPRGIDTDPDGNYYLALAAPGLVDGGSAVDGGATPVAGGGPSTGDGLQATQVTLATPTDVAVASRRPNSSAQGLVIAEKGANAIRYVAPDGVIQTIAGGGSSGYSGDGGPADQAKLNAPTSVAVTAEGLLIADNGNRVIRRIASTWLTAGPPALTNSTTADFSFQSWDPQAAFICKRDAAVVPCSAGTAHMVVEPGVHTFTVAYTDGFSRTDPTPETRTWTVDTEAPARPTLTSPADGASGQPLRPSFAWDRDADVARYEVLVDGAVYDGADLSEGHHTWQVRAFDAAGNTSTSAALSFAVGVPPVAVIVASPNPSLAGRSVTFDGSGSTDEGSGIARYEWDLDGDGSFETDTGSKPTASRVYATPQTVTVRLRVVDGVELSNAADTLLRVTSLAPAGKPIGVSIDNGAQYTNNPNVTIFSVWPAFATDMLVSNDGGFGKALAFPLTAQLPWKLDSSGPERLPKTIYVRFSGGLQTSETFTDDIILDETAPLIVAATITPAANASAAARTLKLKATDNVSGVAATQIALGRHKPGRFRKYQRKLRIAGSGNVRVRVRDRAGNLSRWRAVRG